MAQQISMERALDAAQEAIGKLTWEKVLLAAHNKELAARVEELEAQLPGQWQTAEGRHVRQGPPGTVAPDGPVPGADD